MNWIDLDKELPRYIYESDDEYQQQLLEYLCENKVRLVDFYSVDTDHKYLLQDTFVKAYSLYIYDRWCKDRSSYYRRFKRVNERYTVALYKYDEYRGFWLIEKRKGTHKRKILYK